jgi:hypothetical protein
MSRLLSIAISSLIVMVALAACGGATTTTKIDLSAPFDLDTLNKNDSNKKCDQIGKAPSKEVRSSNDVKDEFLYAVCTDSDTVYGTIGCRGETADMYPEIDKASLPPALADQQVIACNMYIENDSKSASLDFTCDQFSLNNGGSEDVQINTTLQEHVSEGMAMKSGSLANDKNTSGYVWYVVPKNFAPPYEIRIRSGNSTGPTIGVLIVSENFEF